MAQTQAKVAVEQLEELRQAHIGRLLLVAQRNYSERALAKLRERGHSGLSLAHTNLLPHMELGGIRITVLAERAGVSKQAIGSLVVELEARDYIRRTVDPEDRRAVLVTYTDAGWQFLQDAHQVKREVEAEYAALLGEAGLQELRQLLTTLNANTG